MTLNPKITAILSVVFVAAIIIVAGQSLIGQAEMANLVANIFNIPASLVGFQTLSLTQADFISKSDFFNENTWILTVRQGGLAQHAEGIMEDWDIESKSGERPENDLKISIDYATQQCEYSFVAEPEAKNVYSYRWEQWGPCIFGITEDDARAVCPNLYYYGIMQDFPWVNNCFCVDRTQLTAAVAVHTIETGYPRTISDISVEAKGQQFSEQIDTKTNINTYIGNNVYVSWNGDLLRQFCPDKDRLYMFYHRGEWESGLKTNYENYKTARDRITAVDRNTHNMDIVINDVNIYAAQALIPQPFGQIPDKTDMQGAILVAPLEQFVISPTYTFFIKAAWLGIYTPLPDIRIISATSQPFKTYGNIDLTLKNFGETANAMITTQCNLPFNTNEQGFEVAVLGGQQITTPIPISANVDRPTTGQCTVNVNDGHHFYSVVVSVSASPEILDCIPGVEKNCNMYDQVIQCNIFGSGWDIVDDCPAKNQVCRFRAGEYKCVDEGGDGKSACVSQAVAGGMPEFLAGPYCYLLAFIPIFIVSFMFIFISAVILRVIPFTKLIGKFLISRPGIILMLVGALVLGFLFTPFMSQIALIANLM